MKGSSYTKNYFKNNYEVEMTCSLTAELNMNRYHSISTISDSVYGASNTTLFNNYYGDYTKFYKDRYDASSVCKPNRPTSGIFYARFGPVNGASESSSSKLPTVYWNSTNTMNNLRDTKVATLSGNSYSLKPRLYFPSSDNIYKYFSSANQNTQLPIYYTDTLWTNKIVVGFEVTSGKPSSFKIEMTSNSGTSWTEIGTTAASSGSGVAALNISADSTTGQVSIYRTSGGSWSTTRPTTPVISNCIKINGLRVTTTAMSNTQAYTSIIEISPRIEVDLTSRLISWSTDSNLSESDSLNPIGTISSNTGSIQLDNTDTLLNDRSRSTSSATLAELNRKWTEFRLSVSVNNGVSTESIKQFTMLGDEWQVNDAGSCDISLFDMAVVLQETPAPPVLISNVTPTQAIWRVLDYSGFNNVLIKIGKTNGWNSEESIIDEFYCNESQTVWDVIKSICNSFHYAVYIDENGYINITDRSYVYVGTGDTRSVDWVFRGQTDGTDLANISSYNEAISDEINFASIKYSPISSRSRGPNPDDTTAKFSSKTLANVQLSTRTLYRPQGIRLLGQSVLSIGMNDSQTICYIYQNSYNDSWWGAFSGYFLIDSEIIKYDGAEFTYYSPTDSIMKTVIVKTSEELKNLVYSDALGAVNFTGKLCNLERGQFGTSAAAHQRDVYQWTGRTDLGTVKTYVYGANASTGNLDRYLGISGGNASQIISAHRDLGRIYNSYIAKVNIDNSYSKKEAGMIIYAEKGSKNRIKSGIKIELNSNDPLVNKVIVSRLSNYSEVSPITIKIPVEEYGDQFSNREVDFGASVFSINIPGKRNWRRLYIYVDGEFITTYDFNPSTTPGYNGFALFAQGTSVAKFRYAGATDETEDFWNELWNHDKNVISSILSYNRDYIEKQNVFLDKFGSVVREVYIDTINFTKFPARSVNWYPIYNANGESKVGYDGIDVFIARPNDIASAISKSSPFKATFAIANVGNRPVVLSGSSGDSGGYPFIYGNIVERQSELTVEKKNDDSIQRIGKKTFDVSPAWITNNSAAEDAAQWIIDWQKNGILAAQMDTFSNPLHSILDFVDIKFDRLNITTSENFIISQISQQWGDGGLSTKIGVIKV